MKGNISKVIEFALEAHEGQPRKGTSIPYIVHPIESAILLAQNGARDSVVLAGLLHDIIEDTTKTEDDIREVLTKADFEPEYILDLVRAATEPLKLEAKRKGINVSPCDEIDSWRKRKEHTINALRELSGDSSKLDVQLVTCADKLSNIRAMVHDYHELEKTENNGMKLFDRFNAKYLDQKWYYESLVGEFEDLSEYPMYQEFKARVRDLFKE